MKKSFLVFAAMVALSGCAGYSIKNPVSGENYRVYRPQPYLLLLPTVEDPEHPYTGKIVYLPDYSKPYEIKSWSGFGKADFSFTINEGWQLTAIADKADNTSLMTALPALLATAKTLIPSTDRLLNTTQRSTINFLLFRIIIDENSGQPRLEQVPN